MYTYYCDSQIILYRMIFRSLSIIIKQYLPYTGSSVIKKAARQV